MVTNVTRFVVISYGEAARTGDDKTSVAFTLPEDVPGSLYRSIRPIAEHELQLTKLESRPSKTHLGNYVFLVDFLGHRQDPVAAEALRELEAQCTTFKIFGSYPRFPIESLVLGQPE